MAAVKYPVSLIALLLLFCLQMAAASSSSSSSSFALDATANDDDTYDYLQAALQRKLAILRQEEERDDSGGKHGHHRNLSPSIGTIRTLVLLVRFTDHRDRTLPPKSHFEQLCTNEIKPYFYAQSYGKYDIECDVQDWLDTDNTEVAYANGNSNLQNSQNASAMFWPVLNQIDTPGFDWSQYDSNDDTNIDSLMVIHSGYAAEQGLGKKCNAPHPNFRIHSQGHGASTWAWMSKYYPISLSGYAIASAFDRPCKTKPATMGVWTHEWIHTFGTPDLYDVGTRNSRMLGGTGHYDIMSSPFGPTGNGSTSSLSVFTKERIGWMTPTEIVHDGTYTIRISNEQSDSYIIRHGFAENEYLLIENRDKIDYDVNMPGRGILIFHADNAVKLQDKPGYPGQTGWPGNGQHYRVALLQADGQYDLEQKVNNGDDGDYWKMGSGSLSPNGFPNTNSYQNGQIRSTGITIGDFSAAGYEMSFTVSGLAPAPPITSTQAPVKAPTKAPTTDPPTAVPTKASDDNSGGATKESPTGAPSRQKAVSDLETERPTYFEPDVLEAGGSGSAAAGTKSRTRSLLSLVVTMLGGMLYVML